MSAFLFCGKFADLFRFLGLVLFILYSKYSIIDGYGIEDIVPSLAHLSNTLDGTVLEAIINSLEGLVNYSVY